MKLEYVKLSEGMKLCTRCGCVIGDTDLHDEFETSMYKIRDFLTQHRVKI